MPSNLAFVFVTSAVFVRFWLSTGEELFGVLDDGEYVVRTDSSMAIDIQLGLSLVLYLPTCVLPTVLIWNFEWMSHNLSTDDFSQSGLASFLTWEAL